MCLNQPESKIVHHEIGPLCQKVWGPLIQTIDINDVENRKKKKGENKRQGSLTNITQSSHFFPCGFPVPHYGVCFLIGFAIHPNMYFYFLYIDIQIYIYIDRQIYIDIDIQRDISWTEEPGSLQFIWMQRGGHDLETECMLVDMRLFSSCINFLLLV